MMLEGSIMRYLKLLYKYLVFLPLFSKEYRLSLFNILKFKYSYENKDYIVFYDSFSVHYSFTKPIIQELNKRTESSIILIVGEKNHPALVNKNSNIEVIFISNKATVLFKLLKIKLMLTPSSYFSKKFKPKNVNLVHMFHSIVSMHYIYGDGAFDAYDTFFAVGPHHMKELKRTAVIRGWKEKEFLEIGYPKIQALVKEQSENTKSENIRVLFAPSWGEYNLLKIHGVEIVNRVLSLGHEIVVRPHPHSFMYDNETIKQIKEIEKNNTKCKIEDSNFAAFESFKKADILISDYSGAAYEFAFGLLKPVLFIDVPKKISSLSKEQLEYLPMEVTCRENIGAVTTMNDFIVNFNKLIDNTHNWEETLKNVRKECIFNPSNSVEKAVEAIIRLKEKIDAK